MANRLMWQLHHSLCIEYEIAQDVMRGTRVSIEHIRRVAMKCNIDIEF
jgi:hypothetical protein